MKPSHFIVSIIVAVGITGLVYVWTDNNKNQSKPDKKIENVEIETGQIQVDYANLGELQRLIDEGHQPWRLDPSFVARVEVQKYGFTKEDADTLKFSTYAQEELGTSMTKIQGEIQHKEKTYLITVGQPIPGKGKIWTILKISEK